MSGDTMVMVGVKALRGAAQQIADQEGTFRLKNGVKVTAAQLEAAAQIIEDSDKCWTNFDPTPRDLPGFVHAERQERRALVLDVGILPSRTYRITPTGRVSEVQSTNAMPPTRGPGR